MLAKLQNTFTPSLLSSARFVSLWVSLLGIVILHSFAKHRLTTYCVLGIVLDVVSRMNNKTDMTPAFTESADW